MEMGRNKTYKSLMTLDEAILLIDGTFDGYYEFIEKIKEWKYKARMYDMENESQKEKQNERDSN